MQPKLTKAQRKELANKYYYVPRKYSPFAKPLDNPLGYQPEWRTEPAPIGAKVTVTIPFSGLQGIRRVWYRKLQVTVIKAPNGRWELVTPKPLKDSWGKSWLVTPIPVSGTDGKEAIFKANIPLDLYLNSLRISTFLERAVRGGNKTLSHKEDWSQWEYVLKFFGIDPDKMEVNALNWLIHLKENPTVKHSLPDFDYRKA